MIVHGDCLEVLRDLPDAFASAACALEGVPFLLIEREAAYVEIIGRRLVECGS